MWWLRVLPGWLAWVALILRRSGDWRRALMAGMVGWGILVVVITEILSAFERIAFWPIAIAWTAASVLLVATWALYRSRIPALLTQDISEKEKIERSELAAILAIAAIMLVALIVALICPPNNWDSMSYHMARISNWIDHRSVRNYPTNDVRQLFLGPWTEFAILQLQVLSGTDRLANCVQWMATLDSIIAASLIAQQLGALRKIQILAALLCATIPMGILQASTTQNDACVSLWLIFFISAILALSEPNPKATRLNLFIAAGSLGLGMLTKMTMAMYAAPFCLWLAWATLRRRPARGFGALTAVAVIALAINVPHFARNQQTFASPLGSVWHREKIQTSILTPGSITSNAIRNIAIHFGTPWGNRWINRTTNEIHCLLAPINISDSRTTFLSQPFAVTYTLDEASAGNPFHVLIAIPAITWALASRKGKTRTRCYAACLIVGFLLLCAELKWQPWTSRFELPLFVAATPICALFLHSSLWLRRTTPVIATVLVTLGLYTAMNAATRPLIGHDSILFHDRADLYFYGRPGVRQPYLQAAALDYGPIAHIGLIAGQDDWEYPIRLLIHQRFGLDVKFQHIAVHMERKTPLADYPSQPQMPDFIIEFGKLGHEPGGYQPIYQSDAINVLKKN